MEIALFGAAKLAWCPSCGRVLVLGRIGDDWLVASETCALDLVGADYVREVEASKTKYQELVEKLVRLEGAMGNTSGRPDL